MNKSLEYLRKSFQRNRENPIGSLLIAGLKVYIKEPLANDVNIQRCLEYIARRMPSIFLKNIDIIQIGNFPFLKKREVECIYKDKVIYMTNNFENEHSFISNIVHEISHSFEETNPEIYEDKTIENEFLSKRDTMLRRLEAEGLVTYPIKKDDFFNLNYSMSFDNYLYHIIGYEKLYNLTKDIFISPYAATCLREYFANSFENFFVNDINLVKKYSPNIYKKLFNYLEF